MQEHVHLGHGEGDRIQLLAPQPWRPRPLIRMTTLIQQPGLDQEATRAAGRIVNGAVGHGIDQLGNEVPYLFRGVKLPRRLPLPLGELAQQILICPS